MNSDRGAVRPVRENLVTFCKREGITKAKGKRQKEKGKRKVEGEQGVCRSLSPFHFSLSPSTKKGGLGRPFLLPFAGYAAASDSRFSETCMIASPA
ncbi:MAG TPA: hypothetical protein VFO57_08250, partial [Burkholderiales bacterium]|nr:hypothetical protein [Burkholderiales bacterium]